jgi:hypothetical protein
MHKRDERRHPWVQRLRRGKQRADGLIELFGRRALRHGDPLSAHGESAARELKLFDSPFGFAEAPSDFANAAFVDETLADHPALNLRKLVDKPREMNVALDEVQISGREIGLGQGMLKLIGLLFAIGALEIVDDRVRGNTEKQAGKGVPRHW